MARDSRRPVYREVACRPSPRAHHLWQRAFARDPPIVGRTVLIDGAPHTVIGIMPVRRGYPADAEVWRPLTADERADDDRELQMVARLQREIRVARASAEIATLARGVSNGTRDAWVENLQRMDLGNVSAALTVLFVAAMLTLLVACVNVAGLIGARSEDRAGEMAIRGALGATRARVLKQLLCESLVLVLAGGAFGLLIGRWAPAALVAIAPVTQPKGSARTYYGSADTMLWLLLTRLLFTNVGPIGES